MSASPKLPFGPWEDAMSVRANNALQQVRALYEALSRGALGPLYEALDEAVVWEFYAPAALPFAGVWRGRADVARFWSALDLALDSRFEMREFVVMGERVVAIGRQSGVVRATGRAYDVPVIHVWELSSGRVTRWRCALDSGSVVEALQSAPAS